MVAALRVIQGEYAVAFFAVDAGVKAGDADVSAQTLKTMIQSVMYDNF